MILFRRNPRRLRHSADGVGDLRILYIIAVCNDGPAALPRPERIETLPPDIMTVFAKVHWFMMEAQIPAS